MRIVSKLHLIVLGIIVALTGMSSSVMANTIKLPEDTTKKVDISIGVLSTEIRPGAILHMQHNVYNRHGSAASTIMQLDWAVPEYVVGDIWLGPADSNGFFVGYKSILRDVNGNTVQETNASGDSTVHRDTRTGKESSRTWAPMSAPKFLDSTTNIIQKLLEDGWNLSSRDQRDGNGVIVFEKTITPRPEPNDGSTLINIPYTIDLNPVAILFRAEIRLDNPLLRTDEMWTIDEKGARTLISRDGWIIAEILY